MCHILINEPYSIENQVNPLLCINDNGLNFAFENCDHVFRLGCIQRQMDTISVCLLSNSNHEWDFAKMETIAR